MKISQAIEEAMARRGVTTTALAKTMGYKTGMRGLSAKLHSGTSLSVNSALEMLGLLKYKMVIMPEDEYIDPSKAILIDAEEEKWKYSQPE